MRLKERAAARVPFGPQFFHQLFEWNLMVKSFEHGVPNPRQKRLE